MGGRGRTGHRGAAGCGRTSGVDESGSRPARFPWRQGRHWRQTWVADVGGAVVGAATVGTNRVHDDRLLCAVEVAPWHRRKAVGSDLLATCRAGRPDSRPLRAKVAPGSPGHAFAIACGATVYQRCQGAQLDPSAPTPWFTTAVTPAGAVVDSLEGIDAEELVAAWVEQYVWVHQAWSPVTSVEALTEEAQEMLAELDRGLSSGTWVDGLLVALICAFPDGEYQPELVAETVRADILDGRPLLAAALARTLMTAARHDIRQVQLDGHATDPHLHPLLQSLPWSGSDPLLLVELAVRGSRGGDREPRGPAGTPSPR